MDAAERHALLTLLLTPGFGPTTVNRCVDALGSAQAVLDATGQQLAQIPRISLKGATKLLQALSQTQADRLAERELDGVQRAKASLLAFGEPGYPTLLKHIPDPPPLLWMRGKLTDEDALGLGVVGARKCTQYGREQADRFAYQCAQAGLCIVSGGAYGIDSAAHHAALRAGGRTVAVLGSGLGKPYPRENIDLFASIVADDGAHGAVISEVPLQTPPTPELFPRRNRIISGLSLGILVVEAAVRSGALITARLCVEEHSRELMAIPGRVDSATSAGCHKMIREGWAKLVTNAADVLDGLGEAGQILKAELKPEGDSDERNAAGKPSGGLFEANLTPSQQQIVETLGEPRSLDQIAAWTQLPVHQVQAELTMLEVRGTVQRRDGLFLRRKSG